MSNAQKTNDGRVNCGEPGCTASITTRVLESGKVQVTCEKGHVSIVTQPALKKP